MKKLFLEPITLIDIYNGPSLRMGIEVPVSRAFSVLGVGGVYASGYYVKAGAKRYGTTEKTKNAFIELSVFVKNNVNTISDNKRYFDSLSYEPRSGASMRYDVEKFVYGGHIAVGSASRWRHWTLEWYAGAGIRVRTVRPAISDYEQNALYHYHESMMDHFTNSRTSSTVAPSVVLGIRTGYAFGPLSKRRQ